MSLDRWGEYRCGIERSDTGDWCKYHEAMAALAAKDEEIKRLMAVIALVSQHKEHVVLKRHCGTCKHGDKAGSAHPCCECDLDVRSKSSWEKP